MAKKTVWIIEWCDNCKKYEKDDLYVTESQMEWILLGSYCRHCAMLETKLKANWRSYV